jgi:hypothetical protein
MLAVQPFHLQRSKQRLRAGVVPAVSLAAHRWCNAMLFEYLTEGEHIRFGDRFMRPLSLELRVTPRNLRSVH